MSPGFVTAQLHITHVEPEASVGRPVALCTAVHPCMGWVLAGLTLRVQVIDGNGGRRISLSSQAMPEVAGFRAGCETVILGTVVFADPELG